MFASYLNRCRLLPLILAVLAMALPARAAESYLNVVPSTALAFGAVNHIDSAAEKVEKLAKIVQAPATSILDEIKKEAGIEKGLDEKGAVGLFLVPTKVEKEPVAAAVFVAITSEKEFLSNFKVVKTSGKLQEVELKNPAIPTGDSPTHCLAILHGYAVIAPKNDRAAVEAAIDAKQNIAAEMNGYESWLAENDAYVVGTSAGIKFAAKQMQDELKKAKQPSPTGSMPPDEVAFLNGIQQSFGTALESAPKEFSLAMAGIRCDKDGNIRTIGRVRLVSGGSVSKTIAQLPPLKEKLLSDVPGGPFLIAMAGVSVPGLMDSYLRIYGDLLKLAKTMGAGPDLDLQSLMKESMEALGQVRGMSFVWKQGKRSEPIYSNIYSAFKVGDSEKMLAAYEKYAANVTKMAKEAKQSSIKSIDTQRLQVGGKPALQMETTMDFSSAAGGEQSRAILDLMLGVGGKLLVYYVAADEHTALMGMGVAQERMATALDVLKQPKKSLAEDAELSVTSAMLPADSQWVAYVSFRGMVQMYTRVLTAALKSMPGAEDIAMPAFPKSPPLGVAIKATSDELHAEVAVPGTLIEATGEFEQEVVKMVMQRAMQGTKPPTP